MTQSTMTKPSTSTSTYNPYSGVDSAEPKKTDTDAPTADSVPAEPIYKLVIDENVVEKISSLAAQKIDGIIDMKGNVLSRIQEGLGGDDKTKGVSADIVDDAGAKLDLDVILEYGKSAPQVFDEIKKVVGGDLKDMNDRERGGRHDPGRVRQQERLQHRRRAARRVEQLTFALGKRRAAEPSRPRSALRSSSPPRIAAWRAFSCGGSLCGLRHSLRRWRAPRR